MLKKVFKFLLPALLVLLVMLIAWVLFQVRSVASHARGDDVAAVVGKKSVLDLVNSLPEDDSLSFAAAYTAPEESFAPEDFLLPPMDYRPWTRWWWPGNAVSQKELIREIQMMYDAGFGGMEIQPFSSGVDVTDLQDIGGFSWDSEIFYANLDFALSAAERRGMKMDLNAGSGWPTGGGHISVDDNLKTLAFGEAHILGGKQIDIDIPPPGLPGAYYLLGGIEEFLGGSWNNLVDFFPEKARLLTLIGARTLEEHRTFVSLDFNDYVRLNPDSLFLISEFMVDSSRLVWDVPKGYWKIIAVYEMPVGERPTLAAKEDPGFVVDHFDSVRVMANYQYLFGPRTGLPKHYRKGLRAIFNDSFEFKADRHFATGFLEEFRKRRGYDLVPYLPAVIVPGTDNFLTHAMNLRRHPEYVITEEDERIRYDYAKTISELFLEGFMKTTTDWMNPRGIAARTQAYGMEMDIIKAAGMADIPETEQLYAGGSELFLKIAASGAFLYDKNIVSAEALVHQDMGFTFSPQRMKIGVDKLFASGINQVVFHGTPYKLEGQPYGETDWQPFISPRFPIQFSSSVSESSPYWQHQGFLNRYISRCQYVLRQGAPVNDILIYYPFLGFPTSFSLSKSHQEEYFLGKIPGQDPPGSDGLGLSGALTETPEAVKWLENIWPVIREFENRGLTWHWVNDESVQAAVAENGEIDIRGKKSQGLVLLDVPTIEVATARNLAVLSRQGARVVVYGTPPSRAPGFLDFEENDLKVSRYLREIISPRRLSEPADMVNYLTGFPVPQNISYAGSYDFLRSIRRSLPNGSDFVFYRNTMDNDRFFEIRLNKSYEYVYWMDPVNGLYYKARPFEDNRYQGYLKPYGSVFLYATNDQPFPDSLVRELNINDRSLMTDRDVTIRNLPEWDFIIAGPDVPGGEVTFEDTTLFEWGDCKPLRYVSSEGLYTTYFELGENLPDFRYLLDLGTVYGTVDVKINTEPAGSIVFPPYRLEITDYLVPGPNAIEVWITPPLRNRFVGRARKGDENYRHFSGDNIHTLPVGVLGPVKILEFSQ